MINIRFRLYLYITIYLWYHVAIPTAAKHASVSLSDAPFITTTLVPIILPINLNLKIEIGYYLEPPKQGALRSLFLLTFVLDTLSIYLHDVIRSILIHTEIN